METTEKTASGGTFRKVMNWIIDSVPYAVIMGLILMTIGDVVAEKVIKAFDAVTHASASDAGLTMEMYLRFLGIWAVFLLAMACIRRNRFMLKNLWKERKGNTVRNLLIGLAIGAGSNMLCIVAAILNKDIAVHFEGVNPILFVLIFLCVFVQSSAEELVCRGYMYDKICRRHRPITAILVTAALFAVMHLGNPGVSTLAIIDIFVSGLQFAVIVYYMDSIWLAFAAHAGWNFTQNILMGLPNSGQVVPFSAFKLDAATARDSWCYNVGFGVEGTIFAIIVNLAVPVVIWFLYRKKKPSVLLKPTGTDM